jgi:hypothetical protein
MPDAESDCQLTAPMLRLPWPPETAEPLVLCSVHSADRVSS